MADDYREAKLEFRDAPAGTCQYCGKKINGPQKQMHPACRELYGKQRNYRKAAIKKAGRRQHCALAYLGNCSDYDSKTSDGLEADHPQRLADRGRKERVQLLCVYHHKNKTRAENRRDHQVSKKSQQKGQQAQGGWTGLVLWLALMGQVGLVAYLYLHGWMDHLTQVMIGELVLVTLALTLVHTRRRRATHKRALVLKLSDHLNIPEIQAKVLREVTWSPTGAPIAGEIEYGPEFNDSADTPADRDKAESYITQLAGQPTGFEWQLHRNRLRWFPRTGPTPEPEVIEPTSIQTREERMQGLLMGSLAPIIGKDGFSVAPADFDAIGPKTIVIRYPDSFLDDQPEKRLAVQERVTAKAPGRWRASWDTHNNVVALVRRPPMPMKVDRPVLDSFGQRKLRLGVDEFGDVSVIDFDVTPHALIVGSTGAGKSVVISGLIIDATRKGWRVVIVDGKGSTFAGFRTWPNVVSFGLGDAREMSETLTAVEAEMRERYRRVLDEGVEPDSFTPTLVIIDEAAEFAINITRWWKSEGKKESGTQLNTAPALDAQSALARLGRECGIHLVVGLQQAAADFFGGTEARDNYGARVGCGPLSQQGATMAFGDSSVGRDLPKERKGLATVDLGGDIKEVQTYWTPRPKPNGSLLPVNIDSLSREKQDEARADAALLQALRPHPEAVPA